ncbi:hypothetical protein CO610_02115 [Lysobacteraceae bacterium NML95-0200]|nr:hypothetical protein CO610_02115 [Xanthomonadaceae bacterium NML95-0200]
MDYYPAIGDKFDFNNSRGVRVNGWPKCYGQETQEHMSGLLDKPDGIWTVMALLFNKLLHAHMGWLVPDGIWADRRELYYTHVLRLLERCARQVVEAEAHPLAGTAAAIWMNFRRMKGLIVVDEKAPVIDSQDEKAPVIDPQDEKAPVIDPRDKNLPDSLHMDSAMWVDRSLGEVREIFQWWMENNGGERNELKEVEGLMQDVSFLAWEVASYYTDPFAIGGLGIELPSIQVVIEDTRERVGEVAESKQNDGASGEKKKAKKKGVEKFASDHENARKGLAILKNFSDYDNLSRKKREKLNHLPQRFRECRIVDLDIWLVRLAQLKVCYEKIHQMLSKYGLDKFQARQGEGQ